MRKIYILLLFLITTIFFISCKTSDNSVETKSSVEDLETSTTEDIIENETTENDEEQQLIETTEYNEKLVENMQKVNITVINNDSNGACLYLKDTCNGNSYDIITTRSEYINNNAVLYLSSIEVNSLISKLEIKIYNEDRELIDTAVFDNVLFYDAFGETDIREVEFAEKVDMLWFINADNINNIDNIKQFKNLKLLEVTNVGNLRELSLIGELKELIYLNIKYKSDYSFSSNSKISLKPIESLSNLHYMYLDGGINSIFTDLYALGKIVKLKELSIDRFDSTNTDFIINMRNLEKLALIHNEQLIELSWISDKKNLKYLELSTLKKLDNIPEMTSAMSIETVILYNIPKLENADGLAKLLNMKKLSILHTGINNIEELRNLSKLEHIIIDQSEIYDFNPLAENTNIMEMEIINATNLKFLSEIESLKKLTITMSEEKNNLFGLGNLTNLKKLIVYGQGNLNIDTLKEATCIEELVIDGEFIIEDCSPISSLTNLKMLNIEIPEGSYEKLDYLSGLANLEILALNVSNVNDIKAISKLWMLKSLSLYGLNELPDVSELTVLTDLYISGNYTNTIDVANIGLLKDIEVLSIYDYDNIQNFKSIEKNINLEELNILVNNIEPIIDSINIENLKFLNLSYNNNLKDISTIINFPNLEHLNISETSIEDISPILLCESLSLLNIRGCKKIINKELLNNLKNIIIIG